MTVPIDFLKAIMLSPIPVWALIYSAFSMGSIQCINRKGSALIKTDIWGFDFKKERLVERHWESWVSSPIL